MGLRSDIEEGRTDVTLLTAQVNELIMGTTLALRYDQDADPPTVAYLGQAQPGTATAAALWRIQKLSFGVDGDVTAQWADGDADFDNVWDNRAALTYT
jgi:hypothetical protein